MFVKKAEWDKLCGKVQTIEDAVERLHWRTRIVNQKTQSSALVNEVLSALLTELEMEINSAPARITVAKRRDIPAYCRWPEKGA